MFAGQTPIKLGMIESTFGTPPLRYRGDTYQEPNSDAGDIKGQLRLLAFREVNYITHRPLSQNRERQLIDAIRNTGMPPSRPDQLYYMSAQDINDVLNYYYLQEIVDDFDGYIKQNMNPQEYPNYMNDVKQERTNALSRVNDILYNKANWPHWRYNALLSH
jgi:hypothetical protein